MEEHIMFQKPEGLEKNSFVKYIFYENDLVFVNHILNELNKEVVAAAKEKKSKTKNTIQIIAMFAILIILLYILILLMYA
jgi:hypothetical protein